MTASNTHGKSAPSTAVSATTKSELSTATLEYADPLEKGYGSAGITSNPSWTGAGTPASPAYSIAPGKTTGGPTEDGTALSSDGISIDTTTGVITVGTAVEVKHSGGYVVNRHRRRG